MMTAIAAQPTPASFRRRCAAIILAMTLALGLSVGSITPAQAAIGMYHVSKNWWQAYAALTSTGSDGIFQARARLGSQEAWGVRSRTNTKAEVNGFSTSGGAWIYVNNGRVWASA